ncbi:major facilitator superfamily domain-containing protein [Fusarium solani]|uniref:Major facilitator superfamily domain-containing protein n=1 Tax=Fusarium solani TaxID=169388 RepID=A0A9P9JZG1_FUSSL|nr:major facilitator superfamily domain-containing protein [Fusarium solani]KAH7234509.1 major facilitator superfamily domain-containing protein [Fusarium solani]
MAFAKDTPSETVEPAANTPSQHEFGNLSDEHENLWIRFMTFVGWYSREMPSSEKLVVLKLDLSILVFGCLSFFTKYLDQQSLTNAFVRQEIGLWGNELNYITATFWASYCGAMIPACYLMTRYPANIVLPSLELGWGLATFGLAWVKNVEAIYAMRFFVGLFECCSFTGTIYIIGSWYKPNEVARRIALFFIASPGGTMFAGYLQAAAYKNLNGVHGLSGWRWLFIIDGIITIGIAFIGYIVFPDVPSRKKPLALSRAEHALAQKRIEGLTAPPQLQLSTTIFRRVLGRWHFYAFVILWTILDLNILPGGQPFSLYLRANPDRYSIVQVNTLPTVTAAIMIVSALTAGVAADRLGNFWIPATITTVPVLIGMILLNVWDVGEKGRLAAFMLQGFMAPMSPMSMGWATVIMANDAEERAVVTASMNAIGQGIMAGAQVGLFPATGAPRWIVGFKSSLGTTVVQLAVIYTILYLSRRDANRQAVTADLEAEFSETQDDGREKAQG